MRAMMEERIGKVANGVAAGFGATARYVYTRGYPVTVNAPEQTTFAAQVAAEVAGGDRVNPNAVGVMGGEDFSRFWLADKSIESLIFWVGGTPRPVWDAAGGNQQKLPSLHSPFWAPDAEAVISTATEAMTLAALDVLKKS